MTLFAIYLIGSLTDSATSTYAAAWITALKPLRFLISPLITLALTALSSSTHSGLAFERVYTKYSIASQLKVP